MPTHVTIKTTILTARARLARSLPEKRYLHSLRVARYARKLALIYHENPDQAYLSGLLHDCARAKSSRKLLFLAKKFKVKISQAEQKDPILLHTSVGACLAREIYGINDPQILQAIKSHMLGRIGMSKLEKIIFIADFLEPGRALAITKKTRPLALINLDLAVVKKAQAMLEYAKHNGYPVSPVTRKLANGSI